MAKLTTENLQRVLDALVATPHWRKAMGVIRASEQLAFNWRAQSIKAAKDNDTSSILFLEWRGTFDFWHAHAGRARTENVILYESVIRDQAINGIETPVLGPDQRPVYCEDPDLIDVSDEDLWNLWGRRNRYLLDDKGRPVPLTKIEQLPAPLRLAVLRQDKRYIEQTNVDVHVSGQVTTAKPLQRLPNEQRPDVARLRALAALPPAQRREQIGASAVPLDARGHRTLSTGLPPGRRDDDLPVLEKPSPFAAPDQPPPAPEPRRPSYARPPQKLDTSGTGRGEPAPGGFKVR